MSTSACCFPGGSWFVRVVGDDLDPVDGAQELDAYLVVGLLADEHDHLATSATSTFCISRRAWSCSGSLEAELSTTTCDAGTTPPGYSSPMCDC